MVIFAVTNKVMPQDLECGSKFGRIMPQRTEIRECNDKFFPRDGFNVVHGMKIPAIKAIMRVQQSSLKKYVKHNECLFDKLWANTFNGRRP